MVGALIGSSHSKQRREVKKFLDDKLGPDDSALVVLAKDADWAAVQSEVDALGFEAQVVQAFHNRFADGKATSHGWVRVTLDGETRDIDPLFWDISAGKPAFNPLSPVTGISPLFKAFTWWGAPAVNAYRYYRTGKDL